MRKTGKVFSIILLFSFVVCTIFSEITIPVQAVTIDLTREIVCHSTYNGWAGTYGDANYTKQWIKTSGDFGSGGGQQFAVGQRLFLSYYYIYRGLWIVDTSDLPDNANITTAELRMRATDEVHTGWTLVVQNGQPVYPHTPIVLGDYNKAYYSGAGGSKVYNLEQWFNVTLNATGRSWINKQGLTKLCLRSEDDINGVAPTGLYYTYFYNVQNPYGENYAPRLYVEYEVEGYLYLLKGAYNEAGVRDGAINITFYRETEAPVTFELDGQENQTSEVVGLNFAYDLGYNESRTFYLRPDLDVEEIYVIKPSEPYYIYYFTVIDLAGVTNAFLESLINLNGSYRVVERWKLDFISQIPFTMSWGTTYKMRIVCDEGTYTFGSYQAGATGEFTLVVTMNMFPVTDYTLGDITIYRARVDDGTELQLNYSDASSNTFSLEWKVFNWIGTELYSDTQTANSYNFSWSFADPTQDYYVTLVATHDIRGTISWAFSYPATTEFENPWNPVFDYLGTFPFPPQYLFGFIIVALVFAVGNQKNAGAAIFFGLVVTAILNVINWLNLTWTWMAICFGVGIIAIISIMRRRKTVI